MTARVLPAAAGFSNPVDRLATASPGDYERVTRLLLADPDGRRKLCQTFAREIPAAMGKIPRPRTPIHLEEASISRTL